MPSAARCVWITACVFVAFALCACARVSSIAPSEMLRGLWPRDARLGRRLAETSSPLSIQHLQLRGTHNSYHRAPRFPLVAQWDYTHAPLEIQLSDQHVRQLELDLRYVRGELMVSHLPIVDSRSNCRSMTTCLRELKRWSKSNPYHLPVFVFVQPKDVLSRAGLDGRLDAIDAAIRQTLPRDRLLLPEDVLGHHESLREAVLEDGWPTLDRLRGRFAFVLFGDHAHRRAYARGRPGLQGRAMFVDAPPSSQFASIMRYDDPLVNADKIRAAVQAGFLVRTRADVALHDDPVRLRVALDSGAHFVCTDLKQRPWLGFTAASPARCNPVTTHGHCNSSALAERRPDADSITNGFARAP